MANPYRSEAKSTGSSKFKAITGKPGGGTPFDASREDSDSLGKAMKSGKQMPHADMKAHGMESKSRLDKYARGGRAKKGNNVTINIVTPRAPSAASPDIGQGEPLPPVGPPPGVGPADVGPPPGPIAAGPPIGPPPGGPPVPMRKRGGAVFEGSKQDIAEDKKGQAKMDKKVAKKANGGSAFGDLKKASGGGVGHKYPAIKQGSISGEGRLAKIKSYGLKPSSKGG